MRAQLPHSIVRQYLEVEVVGTQTNALALQSTVAALCKQSLLPVIEQSFERCCPAHCLIRIDRLELDLGNLAMERLEQELPALLRSFLDTALVAHMADLPESQHRAAGHASIVHAMDDALAYFLHYGTLPSALHLSDGRNFEMTLWACQDEAGSGSGLPSPLSPSLHTAVRSGAAVERLSGQFSVAFQRTLLARMGGPALGALEAAMGHVPARSAGANAPAATDAGHAAPYEEVLADVERLLLRAALHFAAGSGECSVGALTKHALALAGGQLAVRAALKGMLLPELLTFAPQPDPVKTQHAATLDPGRLPSTPRKCIEHPDQAQGIFVENAGLVLLHPFLAPLFDTLAISSGERLLEPARALALLHFLASGQDTGPEYALALPKILCALPLTANVEAGIVTRAVEQAEAFEMLEAVITHWRKLQSTSPDGLRGAFLMRPGKLSERNGEWVLQVEAHAADILLGDLPWGVSAIRLPWMEQILWVEWNQ